MYVLTLFALSSGSSSPGGCHLDHSQFFPPVWLLPAKLGACPYTLICSVPKDLSRVGETPAHRLSIRVMRPLKNSLSSPLYLSWRTGIPLPGSGILSPSVICWYFTWSYLSGCRELQFWLSLYLRWILTCSGLSAGVAGTPGLSSQAFSQLDDPQVSGGWGWKLPDIQRLGWRSLPHLCGILSAKTGHGGSPSSRAGEIDLSAP